MAYLSFFFQSLCTVLCRFAFSPVDLGVNILVDNLDVPHVVAVVLHCATDRTGKMVRTWNDTDMPADVCRDEIFTGLAPPTTTFMPVEICPDWPSTNLAKRQAYLAGSDDDVLKQIKNAHYFTMVSTLRCKKGEQILHFNSHYTY
jgi:hypothetical protein